MRVDGQRHKEERNDHPLMELTEDGFQLQIAVQIRN